MFEPDSAASRLELVCEMDLCVRGESTWIFCARRWYREILSSRFRSSLVASRRSVSNSSILEWVGRLRIELEELILDIMFKKDSSAFGWFKLDSEY